MPGTKEQTVQVYVYDTYVKAKDGHTMHFDVYTLKQDDNKAVDFAKEWLKSIGEGKAKATKKEVEFCHSMTTGTIPIIKELNEKGYYIRKMDGCPK